MRRREPAAGAAARGAGRWRRWVLWLALMGLTTPPQASAAELPPWPATTPAVAPALTPAAASSPADAAAWRVVGLPQGKAPASRLSVVVADGQRVLALQAEASYGTLVHDLAPGTRAGQLAWRWRLLQPNAQADLRQKAGDDSPLKVCASFAMPLSAVPFIERQLLKLARSASGQDLPAATICYVWDSRLSAGTTLDNAYSRRLRWLVLRGPEAELGAWQRERRDLAADFKTLFGDESATVPPLQAIVVGADADNTGGRSLAQIGTMALD